MFNLIREISETVQLANRIANDSGGNGPRWSVFVTNRSFVAQVFTVVFMVLALCGVPLPIPADVAADTAYGIASAVMALWAGAERLLGHTRVIWSRSQAKRAHDEATALSEHDRLSKALKDTGAL
ncbi:hypothetical protein [Paracoccus alkanivorans]|uniref:Uncharacterized protein n=1 Tax=Paracoccus alkanivorans TaxID=2116655 RepID=A0A3M0M803_9RHOB|nr:hypothetical protein [Paracoccus alkanivorans]RMC33759.1 hypothetical protein C9E81_15775 [Paracoccus alkanivorans]